LYGACAGRRTLSRAGVYQLAAPRHPTATHRRAAPRFEYHGGRCPEPSFPNGGGPTLRGARGALKRRGRARRLRYACSWRRPPV